MDLRRLARNSFQGGLRQQRLLFKHPLRRSHDQTVFSKDLCVDLKTLNYTEIAEF
ncbi:hypothetical protein NIES2104_11090 [Leptolyngbya sp. NIES-2104]|nr:hypothetical protein NIES2104_11090 [Leptolyngbya sp. NIES-2104]